MANDPLQVDDDLSGVGLVPPSIEVLGNCAKLDNEIAGQVARLNLAPLLLPQAY